MDGMGGMERDLIGRRVGRVEARPLVQPEVERLLLPDFERVRVDDRRLQHLAAREHAPRDGDRALAASCSRSRHLSPEQPNGAAHNKYIHIANERVELHVRFHIVRVRALQFPTLLRVPMHIRVYTVYE